VRRTIVPAGPSAGDASAGNRRDRHATRSWHPLVVLGLLCALAAQMLLPVVHAPARAAAFASDAVAQLGAGTAPAPEIRAAGPTVPVHDPASCPACQSLLHPKPAAPPPVLAQRALSELTLAFAAPAQRVHDCAALTGHAPRAPPLAALSLA
jgi:hypothetical protein